MFGVRHGTAVDTENPFRSKGVNKAGHCATRSDCHHHRVEVGQLSQEFAAACHVTARPKGIRPTEGDYVGVPAALVAPVGLFARTPFELVRRHVA